MNTTPPSDVGLETYQNPKYHTRGTPFTHNSGMDTGNSMEATATAAAHHSGPIEPAARTPPVPAAAASRVRITSFFSGSSPPIGTGTGTATPAVAHTPTTGTSTGETQKALAEAPDTSATGPETPAAAPESLATTTPTGGETMLPGESHEWLDNDGESLFTEPPKKGKKRTYGKLGHGNRKWFQTNASHALEHPLLPHTLVHTSPVTHPIIITPPAIWPGSGHIPSSKIPLPHPLAITLPVIWPSLFALDSYRRPDITPSISHLLVITPPAAGLLCMALITGGTLDTTPLYKSTPGDDLFKGQKVFIGVCFHPCSTVSFRGAADYTYNISLYY